MMNYIGRKIVAFVFVLTITLTGVSHADNVEIKLGSGDGFKVLDSSGSPLMDILSNGDVGIGVLIPSEKLEVSGNIKATKFIGDGSGLTGISTGAWTTSGSDIYYNSGYVGIGTSSPAQKLAVNGNIIAGESPQETVGTGATIIINNAVDSWYYARTAGDAAAGFGVKDGSNNVYISNVYYGESDFGKASKSITLTKNGNVGIGITSPNFKLEVRGGELSIYSSAPGTDGTMCYSNTGDGNIVPRTCSSSIRYKENLEELFLGLDIINQLSPVTFDWKDSGHHDLGFIAEEVEKISPLLATYNDDASVEGVKYRQLTAVLVNAIKEQQRMIDNIKIENETLKNTLAVLVTEISDMKVALRQNNQFGTKLAKAGDLGNIGQ